MKTTAILAIGISALALAEGQLNLYNWGDYTSPEMIKKFEDQTGIDVTITDYDSNDTSMAKVSAGGHGFDLIVPSHNYLQIFVQKGLLAELDHARLKNFGNIDPKWVDVPWDQGRTHSIPWLWGTVGMGVNTDTYANEDFGPWIKL